MALDFFPQAAKVDFDTTSHPLDVPTVPGSFDKLQEQLASIVDKIDKVPFDSIGKNLDASLRGIDALLNQFNTELAPEAKATLEQARATFKSASDALSGGSPLQQNVGQTLQELQRAARSLRVLSDYLGRHPDALIRGRRNTDPPPAAPAPPARDQQGSKP